MKQYINPQKKLYYHLDRLAAFKDGQRPPPVNVEIDLSNRCSRGCNYCSFAYTHSRGPLAGTNPLHLTEPTGDLMDTGLALRLPVDLEMYGARSITWSGGGEPTLHPDFDLIVQSTRLDQGMYTHGGHIDEARAALLKRTFKWIYVSLDYMDEDLYANDKGVTEAAFEESCNGVRRLTLASGDATIGLGFLLSKENRLKMWEMVKFSWELGVDYVQFRPMIQKGDDREWIDREFLSRIERLAMRSDVVVDADRFRMYRDWRDQNGHGYDTCWWSGVQAAITPDGRVWPCLNKRGFEGAALGDLNEEPFSDIWERSPIQKVNDRCRVMCRGHMPNLILDPMMRTEGIHKNFV